MFMQKHWKRPGDFRNERVVLERFQSCRTCVEISKKRQNFEYILQSVWTRKIIAKLQPQFHKI